LVMFVIIEAMEKEEGSDPAKIEQTK